ncbi:CCDC92/74 N-terminal domain-containing protein [Caenorhabditis elegans]|uniref:CCDC92/74 N-terminal domain-containing protein n=2 Tax=Caenorhabditis elegans TaxID=6239 RepID=Q9TZ50_CAEEL|nr:CCDC92/74 N-terminal domain-containing protein [Caenorhabditis elegans]CCD61961.1 CCDC92/74 N-terminal domain-containing protein [Caenorhabditis elegans]|eukprot:NP_493709.1 Uncharacterized protein CELE_K01A2.10 [Caenorhabditis elegans]
MSTAVIVSRPPSQTASFHGPQHPNRCSFSSSSSESIPPTTGRAKGSSDFEELEIRIDKALKERDAEWRKHEKSQIQFLQNETSNMLKSLHNEINRLGNELREEKRKTLHGDDDSADKIAELEKVITEKEAYTKNLEKKVSTTIQKLQEQITIQSDRIRQLNEELSDRNQTVTHLSQQLRAIKLREAMATSQHRRRASSQLSTTSSPPMTSPSSPHRIFPPVSSGLLSASVAVTYPGNSRISIQKRSTSAMRAPTMPN